MIEYVEIRNKELEIIGIIDVATSIIWHSIYFGVGDFEIYTAATEKAVDLLQVGYYVTRPDNKEVGIIERITTGTDAEDGTMLTASGRFAKSILDRRVIYQLSGNTNTPTILRGNVETEVRKLVQNNAIACPFDSRRNIDLLKLGDAANIPAKIVSATGEAAQKQVSYQNLLEYTDGVLEEYGLSSMCILGAGVLQYVVFTGTDRSKDNASGNMPIVFSQDFDNLLESEYDYNTTAEKNTALIGGEGEGLERFYSLIASDKTGLQRREVFVDASGVARTYTEDGDATVKTYPDAEYKAMLDTTGKQELAPLVAEEIFTGKIDITNGNWIFGRDFFLGDLVTVQDNVVKKYINVRIREVTEVQDDGGYSVDVKYE